MKQLLKINTVAAMLLALPLLLSSCEESEGPLYTPDSAEQKVSFASAKYNDALSTSAAIKIKLLRSATNGELDVPVTFTTDDESFTLTKSTAHFAAGQGEAYVEVAVPDVETLEIGRTYKSSVTVDKSYLSVSGIAKTDISLSRKLTSLGTASLESTWFLETRDIEVQQAGNVYVLVDPYAKGYNLLLVVDDTGKVTVDKQQVDLDSGVAPITVEGEGTLQNGVISLTLDFIMWYPEGVEYYSELGNSEVITLP